MSFVFCILNQIKILYEEGEAATWIEVVFFWCWNWQHENNRIFLLPTLDLYWM